LRVLRHVFSQASFVAFALVALLLAPAVVQGQSKSAPASASAAIEDYRLGAGDEVRITVYGEKDLTGEFYVSASGKISFPLIGDLEADGKTIKEIEAALTSKLKDGYLVDPKVSGEVLIFRPFYILGEVNKPGQYPYTNGLTAIKAIATAQGFTYRANTKRVLIRHSGDSAEREYSLSSVVYLQPGDTVRVVERFF
jgi:polysaccharide export outer membrane protein